MPLIRRPSLARNAHHTHTSSRSSGGHHERAPTFSIDDFQRLVADAFDLPPSASASPSHPQHHNGQAHTIGHSPSHSFSPSHANGSGKRGHVSARAVREYFTVSPTKEGDEMDKEISPSSTRPAQGHSPQIPFSPHAPLSYSPATVSPPPAPNQLRPDAAARLRARNGEQDRPRSHSFSFVQRVLPGHGHGQRDSVHGSSNKEKDSDKGRDRDRHPSTSTSMTSRVLRSLKTRASALVLRPSGSNAPPPTPSSPGPRTHEQNTGLPSTPSHAYQNQYGEPPASAPPTGQKFFPPLSHLHSRPAESVPFPHAPGPSTPTASNAPQGFFNGRSGGGRRPSTTSSVDFNKETEGRRAYTKSAPGVVNLRARPATSATATTTTERREDTQAPKRAHSPFPFGMGALEMCVGVSFSGTASSGTSAKEAKARDKEEKKEEKKRRRRASSLPLGFLRLSTTSTSTTASASASSTTAAKEKERASSESWEDLGAAYDKDETVRQRPRSRSSAPLYQSAYTHTRQQQHEDKLWPRAGTPVPMVRHGGDVDEGERPRSPTPTRAMSPVPLSKQRQLDALARVMSPPPSAPIDGLRRVMSPPPPPPPTPIDTLARVMSPVPVRVKSPTPKGKGKGKRTPILEGRMQARAKERVASPTPQMRSTTPTPRMRSVTPSPQMRSTTPTSMVDTQRRATTPTPTMERQMQMRGATPTQQVRATPSMDVQPRVRSVTPTPSLVPMTKQRPAPLILVPRELQVVEPEREPRNPPPLAEQPQFKQQKPSPITTNTQQQQLPTPTATPLRVHTRLPPLAKPRSFGILSPLLSPSSSPGSLGHHHHQRKKSASILSVSSSPLMSSKEKDVGKGKGKGGTGTVQMQMRYVKDPVAYGLGLEFGEGELDPVRVPSPYMNPREAPVPPGFRTRSGGGGERAREEKKGGKGEAGKDDGEVILISGGAAEEEAKGEQEMEAAAGEDVEGEVEAPAYVYERRGSAASAFSFSSSSTESSSHPSHPPHPHTSFLSTSTSGSGSLADRLSALPLPFPFLRRARSKASLGTAGVAAENTNTSGKEREKENGNGIAMMSLPPTPITPSFVFNREGMQAIASTAPSTPATPYNNTLSAHPPSPHPQTSPSLTSTGSPSVYGTPSSSFSHVQVPVHGPSPKPSKLSIGLGLDSVLSFSDKDHKEKENEETEEERRAIGRVLTPEEDPFKKGDVFVEPGVGMGTVGMLERAGSWKRRHDGEYRDEGFGTADVREWERDVRSKGRNAHGHGRSASADTITPGAGEEGEEELEQVLHVNAGEAYGSWGRRHPYAYAGAGAEADDEDEGMATKMKTMRRRKPLPPLPTLSGLGSSRPSTAGSVSSGRDRTSIASSLAPLASPTRSSHVPPSPGPPPAQPLPSLPSESEMLQTPPTVPLVGTPQVPNAPLVSSPLAHGEVAGLQGPASPESMVVPLSGGASISPKTSLAQMSQGALSPRTSYAVLSPHQHQQPSHMPLTITPAHYVQTVPFPSLPTPPASARKFRLPAGGKACLPKRPSTADAVPQVGASSEFYALGHSLSERGRVGSPFPLPLGPGYPRQPQMQVQPKPKQVLRTPLPPRPHTAGSQSGVGGMSEERRRERERVLRMTQSSRQLRMRAALEAEMEAENRAVVTVPGYEKVPGSYIDTSKQPYPATAAVPVPVNEPLSPPPSPLHRKHTVRVSHSDSALRMRSKVLDSASYETASTSPPRHLRSSTELSGDEEGAWARPEAHRHHSYSYARRPSSSHSQASTTSSLSYHRPSSTQSHPPHPHGYARGHTRGPSSVDLDLIEERWEGGTSRSTAFYSARSSIIESVGDGVSDGGHASVQTGSLEGSGEGIASAL